MPVRRPSSDPCGAPMSRHPNRENHMSTATHAVAQESKVRTVFRVVSGNFLEMYDFMVFGYYASAIA
jgi:hypothetical protein